MNKAFRDNIGKHADNLKPFHGKEASETARLKGLETRRRNKAAKEAAKHVLDAMKDMEEEDLPTGIQALNYALGLAISQDDTDQIVRIASILAEYQTPKLSRQEVTQTMIDATDLSDAELEEELQKLSLQ